MSIRTQKIILTRPVAQAQPLAQRLTALGYSVALFPLLEIAPLPEKSEAQSRFQASLANLSRYALAVFVSPNAIHAVFQNGFIWPVGVSIAVMGEGSRSVLAQYGIDESQTTIYCATESDSESLLGGLDLAVLKGRDVAIFRAESGRELLADALKEKGIHVEKIVAYQRLSPSFTAQTKQQLAELLASPNDWVVSSSEAIRTLADMIIQSGMPEHVDTLQQLNLWVSHQRIAQTAEKCGFKRIHLIGSGDENLLHALQYRSADKSV